MLNLHYAKRRSGAIKGRQLSGRLSVALLNSQKRMLKQLREYVSTWDHVVIFETKGGTHYAGGNIRADIYTDDQIFWWLEEGTRVRYAIMNDPYATKTAPGQINSRAGYRTYKGGKYYHLDMNSPVIPGIEPRYICAVIVRNDEAKFKSDILAIASDIDFLEGAEGILG